jgi:ubiquinone/menaquinone biosynthesis C-methylase UbiE
MAPALTPARARAFYDRFGTGQDRQAFYEDAATRDLVDHLGLDDVHAVLEFGCGTGRFAATLLSQHLGPETTYSALDSSATMVDLAKARLAPWRDRVEIGLSDGGMTLSFADSQFDCFISTYVLDLLSEADINALLAETHRVLTPGGRLGLVGLTPGRGPVTRLVSSLAAAIHAIAPQLLGGCRPMEIRKFLPESTWRLSYHGVVSAWAITSQVIVARAH